MIRGFGPVKDAHMQQASDKRRRLLEQLHKSNDGGSDDQDGSKEFLAAAE